MKHKISMLHTAQVIVQAIIVNFVEEMTQKVYINYTVIKFMLIFNYNYQENYFSLKYKPLRQQRQLQQQQ